VGLYRKAGEQHAQADKRTPVKPIDHDGTPPPYRYDAFLQTRSLANPAASSSPARIAPDHADCILANQLQSERLTDRQTSRPPDRRDTMSQWRIRHLDGIEMEQAAYVAVDWGTSSFRLWLVDRAGNILGERRSHEGMMVAGKLGFATVLQSHLEAVGAAPGLPVIVCGMAGARGGWVEAGYVDTPARLTSILKHAVTVPGRDRDIRILPGIAQRDPKAPDVMRGEETQLLGALGMDAADDAVVCMPGTHSKWVRANGGTVERFATFMTGELFDAVSRETILSHAVAGSDEAEDIDAFTSAVMAAFETPSFAANLLFQVRSGQLLYGGKPSSAREKISGTLIGLELAAGLAGEKPRGGITLVASGRLQRLYQLAFDTVSVPVRSIGAEDAVRRGLSMAAGSIWNG
jgi:2-dehydro-3-deoxygalactonokinase